MKVFVYRWLPAMLMAALLASAACAQATTGTVKGSVTAPGGPVAGARVMVLSAAVSAYTAESRTDADGAFAITDVPIGGVEVRVFDSEGKLVSSDTGTLNVEDGTITFVLRVS